jgi:hypothetical protein
MDKNIKFTPDLKTWLVDKAKGKYLYLLAFAADGVIWGRFDNDGLRLSGDAFPEKVDVKLDEQTLQLVRSFGGMAIPSKAVLPPKLIMRAH